MTDAKSKSKSKSKADKKKGAASSSTSASPKSDALRSGVSVLVKHLASELISSEFYRSVYLYFQPRLLNLLGIVPCRCRYDSHLGPRAA